MTATDMAAFYVYDYNCHLYMKASCVNYSCFLLCYSLPLLLGLSPQCQTRILTMLGFRVSIGTLMNFPAGGFL